MGPAVPFLGPCLGSFFEVFCIKVAEAQRFGFNEALWLMATGRATVPTLYACCLTKRSCHFLFVARVGLCCWFCDFPVSFLVPPDGPKNGTVKVLFFCSFTKLCMRSQKMGPPGGPIFGTVFRFIFWSFLHQGCRSATFWFQWSFVAYGDRKGNCSNSICLLLN